MHTSMRVSLDLSNAKLGRVSGELKRDVWGGRLSSVQCERLSLFCRGWILIVVISNFQQLADLELINNIPIKLD